MAKTLKEYEAIVTHFLKRIVPACILIILVGIALPYLGSALLSPPTATATNPDAATISNTTMQVMHDISFAIITLGLALIFGGLMTWITLPVIYDGFLKNRP